MLTRDINSRDADEDDVNDIEDLIEDYDDREEYEIDASRNDDDSDKEDSFTPIHLPLKAAEAINSMAINVEMTDAISVNFRETSLRETTDVYPFYPI